MKIKFDATKQNHKDLVDYGMFLIKDIVERSNSYWKELAETTSLLTDKKVASLTKEQCDTIVTAVDTIRDIIRDHPELLNK